MIDRDQELADRYYRENDKFRRLVAVLLDRSGMTVAECKLEGLRMWNEEED